MNRLPARKATRSQPFLQISGNKNKPAQIRFISLLKMFRTGQRSAREIMQLAGAVFHIQHNFKKAYRPGNLFTFLHEKLY
ncbi:hypothetical protein [Parafilimonas sp.]|uniref:hypothetical protein n=1 Tax=Parafilimonas sp. TaxID=1969739 RepID=UPI0039E22AD8